jgi:flavin reductase (DIM6/NTAB) family NADH-FMN oxidoreductase RutF
LHSYSDRLKYSIEELNFIPLLKVIEKYRVKGAAVMGKKTFGPQLFIYPMPVVIVGALVNDIPNFNTIAYCGVAQSKPPMLAISMDKRRYTIIGIKENRTFSVNIPSVEMLEAADYVGTFSGRDVDKTRLFDLFYGKLKTAPMIEECPVNIECELVDYMDFGGKNDLLIGKIAETYAEKKYLTGSYPDIKKINPIIFTRQDEKYWETGRFLMEAYKTGKKYNRGGEPKTPK